MLTQLVELAAQVNTHIVAVSGKVPPAEYRESFIAAAEVGALPSDLAAKIAPSAGLRNILVHQYLDADLEIIATSVGQAVNDYAAYVRAIAGWLSPPGQQKMTRPDGDCKTTATSKGHRATHCRRLHRA